MFEVLGEDNKIRERIIRGIFGLIGKWKKRRRILLLALYGSFARGDWKPGSDIDLLIVIEDPPKTYWERWDEFFGIIEDFPIDPHVYSPSEFLSLLKDGRMTPLDALTEGIVLFKEDKFFEEIKRILREVLRHRVKIGNAWFPK